MNKNLKKHMDRMPEYSNYNLLQDLEKIHYYCNQKCHCTPTQRCNSCFSVAVSNNIATDIKSKLKRLEELHEL
jgi:hypothetical protein